MIEQIKNELCYTIERMLNKKDEEFSISISKWDRKLYKYIAICKLDPLVIRIGLQDCDENIIYEFIKKEKLNIIKNIYKLDKSYINKILLKQLGLNVFSVDLDINKFIIYLNDIPIDIKFGRINNIKNNVFNLKFYYSASFPNIKIITFLYDIKSIPIDIRNKINNVYMLKELL